MDIVKKVLKKFLKFLRGLKMEFSGTLKRTKKKGKLYKVEVAAEKLGISYLRFMRNRKISLNCTSF